MKQIELKKYDFESGSLSWLIALSRISGPFGFQYEEWKQNFWIDCSITSKKTKIEILNDEIKSVVLKKNDYVNRDESILYIFLALFD